MDERYEIIAENVSFTYPGDETNPPVNALRGVTLYVPKGSYTAILGRNGSGKSTLARILCMLETPEEGKLYIDGNLMTGDGVTKSDILDARKRVGMVFQNPDNQIVATIVEEDVAFGCENLGVPSDEIRKRVDDALETVGMTKYARHSPHKLSGGQKQRIAIAGVIAMKRDCIIFDESTAMLDPMGRREVLDTIDKLNKEEGVTVILITHYMDEATRADHVVVMNDGGILKEGSPSEVFSDPETLWSASLDVPQTTELLYGLKKKGLDVPLDVFDPEKCAAVIAGAISSRGGSKNGDR
ncbi:MAG: energy-coupling factor transporter ATPase [Clostridia bacterium]|nr:energy-coupling factor transporter ATPase [Clostridia bacterium]